jgi:hypothetical protein
MRAAASGSGMKWNIAIAVLIGFVLAMALTFGGQMVTFPPIGLSPNHKSD